MTIDEAIEVYKHPTQHFSSEHREADKIAIQSMKELKLLRAEICRNKMFRLGYNKAIDDLMEKVSECFISDEDWNYLVQEAERLKAGGTNDAN